MTGNNYLTTLVMMILANLTTFCDVTTFRQVGTITLIIGKLRIGIMGVVTLIFID